VNEHRSGLQSNRLPFVADIPCDLDRNLVIQIENDVISVTHDDGRTEQFGIGTPDGFRILSKLWLRSGWDAKYVYSFTWLGRPIIQLPDDLIRLQEVIYAIQPDVIIEIGIAHGGSLIFSASLCQLIGKGRVVACDIDIRPANREAIEAHPLSSLITLLEGDSISPEMVERIRSEIQPDDKVLICLDGCHTHAHVLAELHAYAPMVSPNSYILAMDGIMQDLPGALRTEPDWVTNNPQQAARDFVANSDGFTIEEPELPFNEGSITDRVTYWPGAFVKRIS